jgi:hypothetical protein
VLEAAKILLVMDSKEFKQFFGEIAKTYHFTPSFGGWFKESNECIAVLQLQKSNYGNHYEMNVKIYVQGMFGKSYSINKEMVKTSVGNIFCRQPNDFREAFDLDVQLEVSIRIVKIQRLFVEFAVPFTDSALSRDGIREMWAAGQIHLLPAVKKELGIEDAG